MAKKKKTEETWECGDCNAELPISTEWCDAPQHEWAEEVIRLRYALRKLSDEHPEKHYITPEEYVDQLAVMLKEYLKRNYGEDKCHPSDLTSWAFTFMESYWIISDHSRL